MTSAPKGGKTDSIRIRVNPIAHRKAKIVYNFGLSECNRIKGKQNTDCFYIMVSASRIICFIEQSHISLTFYNPS